MSVFGNKEKNKREYSPGTRRSGEDENIIVAFNSSAEELGLDPSKVLDNLHIPGEDPDHDRKIAKDKPLIASAAAKILGVIAPKTANKISRKDETDSRNSAIDKMSGSEFREYARKTGYENELYLNNTNMNTGEALKLEDKKTKLKNLINNDISRKIMSRKGDSQSPNESQANVEVYGSSLAAKQKDFEHRLDYSSSVIDSVSDSTRESNFNKFDSERQEAEAARKRESESILGSESQDLSSTSYQNSISESLSENPGIQSDSQALEAGYDDGTKKSQKSVYKPEKFIERKMRQNQEKIIEKQLEVAEEIENAFEAIQVYHSLTGDESVDEVLEKFGATKEYIEKTGEDDKKEEALRFLNRVNAMAGAMVDENTYKNELLKDELDDEDISNNIKLRAGILNNWHENGFDDDYIHTMMVVYSDPETFAKLKNIREKYGKKEIDAKEMNIQQMKVIQEFSDKQSEEQEEPTEAEPEPEDSREKGNLQNISGDFAKDLAGAQSVFGFRYYYDGSDKPFSSEKNTRAQKYADALTDAMENAESSEEMKKMFDIYDDPKATADQKATADNILRALAKSANDTNNATIDVVNRNKDGLDANGEKAKGIKNRIRRAFSAIGKMGPVKKILLGTGISLGLGFGFGVAGLPVALGTAALLSRKGSSGSKMNDIKNMFVATEEERNSRIRENVEADKKRHKGFRGKIGATMEFLHIADKKADRAPVNLQEVIAKINEDAAENPKLDRAAELAAWIGDLSAEKLTDTADIDRHNNRKRTAIALGSAAFGNMVVGPWLREQFDHFLKNLSGGNGGKGANSSSSGSKNTDVDAGGNSKGGSVNSDNSSNYSTGSNVAPPASGTIYNLNSLPTGFHPNANTMFNYNGQTINALDLVKHTIRGDIIGTGSERIQQLGMLDGWVQNQVDQNLAAGLTRWDNVRIF